MDKFLYFVVFFIWVGVVFMAALFFIGFTQHDDRIKAIETQIAGGETNVDQ